MYHTPKIKKPIARNESVSKHAKIIPPFVVYNKGMVLTDYFEKYNNRNYFVYHYLAN